MRRAFILLTCALAGCGGSSPSSSQASGQPQSASAAAAGSSGPRLFISDETGGAVVVVDAGQRKVLQRIEVGKRPRGIRLSPDGKQVFVALSGSPIGGPGVDESKLPPADRTADGIGAVDVASGALVRKFDSGRDPETF